MPKSLQEIVEKIILRKFPMVSFHWFDSENLKVFFPEEMGDEYANAETEISLIVGLIDAKVIFSYENKTIV